MLIIRIITKNTHSLLLLSNGNPSLSSHDFIKKKRVEEILMGLNPLVGKSWTGSDQKYWILHYLRLPITCVKPINFIRVTAVTAFLLSHLVHLFLSLIPTTKLSILIFSFMWFYLQQQSFSISRSDSSVSAKRIA